MKLWRIDVEHSEWSGGFSRFLATAEEASAEVQLLRERGWLADSYPMSFDHPEVQAIGSALLSGIWPLIRLEKLIARFEHVLARRKRQTLQPTPHAAIDQARSDLASIQRRKRMQAARED